MQSAWMERHSRNQEQNSLLNSINMNAAKLPEGNPTSLTTGIKFRRQQLDPFRATGARPPDRREDHQSAGGADRGEDHQGSGGAAHREGDRVPRGPRRGADHGSPRGEHHWEGAPNVIYLLGHSFAQIIFIHICIYYFGLLYIHYLWHFIVAGLCFVSRGIARQAVGWCMHAYTYTEGGFHTFWIVFGTTHI